MKKIFKNKSNRLRSGWVILFTFLAYEVLSFLVFGIIEIIAVIRVVSSNNGALNAGQLENGMIEFFYNSPGGRLMSQGFDFLCLMFVIFLILKLFYKKRFRDIGLIPIKRGIRDLAYGLVLGIVSMTVIFIILLLTRNITLTGSLSQPRLSTEAFLGIFVFVFVGIKEEVLSRGYFINVLNEMGKPWLSIIISSAIFSALHLLNPNLKLFGVINILLVGILFGIMYFRSGSIWMPIGYHITWNYFQGDVFGFPVSGMAQRGVYTIAAFKDNILTGGNFGPEAGILATIVIIIGILFVWNFVNRKSSSNSSGSLL